MFTAVMTSKGQIVLPAKLRYKLNIKKGIKIAIEEYGDALLLKPLTSHYLRSAAGTLKTKGKLSKALLAQRALDKTKEA